MYSLDHGFILLQAGRFGVGNPSPEPRPQDLPPCRALEDCTSGLGGEAEAR